MSKEMLSKFIAFQFYMLVQQLLLQFLKNPFKKKKKKKSLERNFIND